MGGYTAPVFPNRQNQVLPNPVNPWRNQMVFAQMIGEITSENPDLDPSDVQVRINDIVREIYDRRTWYGLMIRGQIVTPGFFVGGTVTVSQNSNQVQGSGTAWTAALIGRQFRLGFNTPPYTINNVDVTNQILTLEMPWGSGDFNSTGYFIAQYYYTMGPNIKYIHTAKNMIMAWRLWTSYNQQTLDSRDPWRATAFTPYALAQMPPDANGNYQVELWPVPSIVQALPWIACTQPPNLINDNDALPPAIRSDIVTKLGMAWAKTNRGPKFNKYYDAQEAGRLRQEAERELLYMAKADEDLYRQNIILPNEQMQMAPDMLSTHRNAIWDINHGVAAEESVWSDF
jgi:hypothetical protein